MTSTKLLKQGACLIMFAQPLPPQDTPSSCAAPCARPPLDAEGCSPKSSVNAAMSRKYHSPNSQTRAGLDEEHSLNLHRDVVRQCPSDRRVPQSLAPDIRKEFRATVHHLWVGLEALRS